MFNAFFTYFGAESGAQKGQSAEEEQAMETSKQVIDDCDLDSVIDDTKFLRTSSLQVRNSFAFCRIFNSLLYKSHTREKIDQIKF